MEKKDFLDAIIKHNKNKFKISCTIFNLSELDCLYRDNDPIVNDLSLFICCINENYDTRIYNLSKDAFAFLVNNGIELDVEEKIKMLKRILEDEKYPSIIKERIEKVFNPDIDPNNNNKFN